MKAIIYNKKSTPSRLVYQDIAQPTIGPSDVLVKVVVSSINAADYRMLQMGMPPKNKIFGADVAGIIQAVGTKVHRFKEGDAILADLSNHGSGGYAEYVAIPEDRLVKKPASVSFLEGGVLPLAGSTAFQALRYNATPIHPKSKILIIGCSGGVGTYAIQIAKYYKATVTGICSSKNRELCLELGADTIYNYKHISLSDIEERFDYILAINGNYPLCQYKSLLSDQGECVVVGGSIKQIIKTMFIGRFMSTAHRRIRLLNAKSSVKDLEFLATLVEEGFIKPHIDSIYPLEETSKAFTYIREQHAQGKIAIQVTP